MPGMTLDAASAERLRAVEVPTELLDHQGPPLGISTPLDRPERDRKAEGPYTDEAIRLPREEIGEAGGPGRDPGGPGRAVRNPTVVWRPVAEQRPAAIRMSASDRDAVARAAPAIDEALRIDPEQVGGSRADDVGAPASDALPSPYRAGRRVASGRCE